MLGAHNKLADNEKQIDSDSAAREKAAQDFSAEIFGKICRNRCMRDHNAQSGETAKILDPNDLLIW